MDDAGALGVELCDEEEAGVAGFGQCPAEGHRASMTQCGSLHAWFLGFLRIP